MHSNLVILRFGLFSRLTANNIELFFHYVRKMQHFEIGEIQVKQSTVLGLSEFLPFHP